MRKIMLGIAFSTMSLTFGQNADDVRFSELSFNFNHEDTLWIKNESGLAIENFQRFLIDFPESKYWIEVYFRKAEFQYFSGDFDSAKQAYQILLGFGNIKSNNGDSLNDENHYRHFSFMRLGEISAMNKEYAKAIEYFEQCKKYRVNYSCGNPWRETLEFIDGQIAAVRREAAK